jgi:hypothetical protein
MRREEGSVQRRSTHPKVHLFSDELQDQQQEEVKIGIQFDDEVRHLGIISLD